MEEGDVNSQIESFTGDKRLAAAARVRRLQRVVSQLAAARARHPHDKPIQQALKNVRISLRHAEALAVRLRVAERG